jgi:hypothetical protein
MPVKLNREALEHARQLIDDGKYIISTQWRTSQPSEQEESKFLDQHGAEEYAKWYLAIDTGEQEGSKDRYKFPYGDFKKVHHSGLIAARQRAAQNDYEDVFEGAGELLDIFDRMNAC